MAVSPFFSGRIPQSLFDAVETYRQQTGESKTDVLVKALSAYINVSLETHSLGVQELEAERIGLLESRVEAIEQMMAKILQQGTCTSTAALLEANSSRMPVDGQMSLYDIEPSEIIENVVETSSNPDNSNNTDNSIEGTQVVGTSEVFRLTGVPRQTLDGWRKEGKLPQERKGFLIAFSHMQEKPVRHFWRLTRVDNTDNSKASTS